MSFGGGGGDTSALTSMLQKDKDRADQERARLWLDTQRKDAEIETKRTNRLKGGGLQAFTTAGYTGYAPDRTLGGGNSLAQVTI